MLNSIFSPWPSYTEEESEAISRVLLSNRVNYWTGIEAREFEKEFATFTGTKYAIALANGTLALDLALIGIGLAPKDEVVVTPRTFIASVSSVVTAGGTPVFADVDADTQSISAQTIERVITSKTKAIIVVHLAGIPAEMDEIIELAKNHNIHVIEDCAQAHGAKYKNQSVGSIGTVGAWSFCQDKIMTTGGEGGMITTNNEELWDKMWSYKDHGKSWDAVYHKSHPEGYRWLHESFGTNWRMTELQAVIGRIQLSRMNQWQQKRNQNANLIFKTCEQCDWIRVPEIATHSINAAYKAYVFIRPEKLPEGWSRDLVLKTLQNKGIPAYSGSCSEVYLEKAFDGTPWKPASRLPTAKSLGENSLMFLVHPTLTEKEMKSTCNAIISVNELMKKKLDPVGG